MRKGWRCQGHDRQGRPDPSFWPGSPLAGIEGALFSSACSYRHILIVPFALSKLRYKVKMETRDISDSEGKKEGDGQTDEKEESAEASAAKRQRKMWTATLKSVQEEDLADGGGKVWRATVEYGDTVHTILVDDLLPADKPIEQKALAAYTKLDPFEFEALQIPFLHHTGMHALHQAFLMTLDAVNNVKVELLGADKKKLPYHLRVTALKKFKPKELVFVPFVGSGGLFLHSKETLDLQKYAEPDTSLFAADSQTRGLVRVRCMEKVKKGAQETKIPQATFFSISPLFSARQSLSKQKCVLDGVQPFWAIGRTREKKNLNMTMELRPFEVPALVFQGDKMPNNLKKAMWAVDIQVCYNHEMVREGEVLHLSMMDENLQDSDDE